MNESKILVATTFRLGNIDRLAYNLKRWKSQRCTSIVALIEEEDYDSSPSGVQLLKGIVDHISTYRFNIDSGYQPRGSKSSPSVMNVLNALKSLKEYEYYVFANADIELRTDLEKIDLCNTICLLNKDKDLTLAHRRDYTSDPTIFKSYMEGLDLFTIARKALEEINFSAALHRFQIGQVGWDYILPLSLPAQRVTTTCLLPIYHKTHKTGSDTNWGDAILSIIPYIHPSWTRGKPLARFTLSTIAHFINTSEVNGHPPRKREWLKRGFYYLASRIVFYGFIEKLFLKT